MWCFKNLQITTSLKFHLVSTRKKIWDIEAVWVKLISVCILYSGNHCLHNARLMFLAISSCFGKAWWASTVCCAHKRRCSWDYVCESTMPVMQDLIRQLTLEEMPDETHVSQIKDCRWNGCTFHASSCCIWMDAETSLTKMYPVSICERQMVVKVCSWAKPEQTVVCFCPNLTSKIRTGCNLLAGCPPLFYVHMH